MPESFKKLLTGNQKWAENTSKFSPDFFHQLSEIQSPEFLWIGCSDSRVPATEITNTLPGAIFVQRNIANMVIHTDYNLLSVVYYAVKVLKVKHIIVCGHYGCGGVKAAMSKESFGFLDNWLLHIKDIYDFHREELEKVEDETERFDRFVEINVAQQVKNLGKISFVQEEWQNREFPYIHGWVYGLENGMIQNLGVSINSLEHLSEIYRYQPKSATKPS